jgi:1,5-anhydro-D-fructose reductase (1,5-anhydro-D-mannitol-forming)
MAAAEPAAFLAGRAEVRWGILGCGDVCEVKSGPAFSKAGGSRLVAVMRRDGAKAADFAARHGVARSYADADALIGDAEVDAVYIAAPPGSHEELAQRVAAARKPCLVEKPMARNAAECERMQAAFARAGVPLFVNYYRRAQPRFLRAAALLAGGSLGAVTGASWRYAAPAGGKSGWRVEPEVSGGGIFMDLASHALDAIDFLLGPLAFVGGAASASAGGAAAVEDSVGMVLTTRAGAPVTVSFNCAAGGAREDALVISCAAGELRLPVFAAETLTVTAAGGAAETFSLPAGPHVAQGMVQAVTDALLGRGGGAAVGGAAAVVSGEAATRTARLMDAALAAFYGGREDGFWLRRAGAR